MEGDAFHSLSLFLTGEKALDPEIGKQYAARVSATSAGVHLKELLDVWSQISANGPPTKEVFAAKVLGNADLAPVVQEMIQLWFIGAIFDTTGDRPKWIYGTPQQFFSALVWPLIGSHPPALSGGYHGHWRYPPDNG